MERRRFIGGAAGVVFGGSGLLSAEPPPRGLAPDCLDVRDFGARGDGKTDDADAILAAIAAANGACVRLPAGQFLLGRELVVTDAVNLCGTPGVTVLLPTRDGGVGLSIDTTGNGVGTHRPSSIYGLTLDGSRTRGATGMVIGASRLSGRIRASHVEIRSFHGVQAVGLLIRDSVDTSFEYSYFGRNSVNLVVEGHDVSLPTLTRFQVCSFREADTVGILIRRGYMTSFAHCLIESNKQEGVHVVVAKGRTALRTSFNGCWFEDNHHAAPDQPDRFHVLSDGTDGTSEIRIAAGYMAGASRAIRLLHTVNFVLDDVLVQPVADTIVTEGGNGVLTNMPLNRAGRLEDIWKNINRHNAVVVGNTPHMSPWVSRTVLEGWSFPGEPSARGTHILRDGLSVAGRVMMRPGHVTRIAVTVVESQLSHPAAVDVERSPDAGRTWQTLAGATIQFVPTPGWHVADVPRGAGNFGEGDLLRLALRDSVGARPVVTGNVTVEIEIDS